MLFTLYEKLNNYILVLAIYEFIANTLLFGNGKVLNDNILLVLLNVAGLIIAYIILLFMVNHLVKNENYEFVTLIGLFIMTILHSCLLISEPSVRSKVLQLGSLIKLYIPISILLCYGKNKQNITIWKKYSKSIGFFGLSIMAAILIKDYKFFLSLFIVCLIGLLLIQDLEKHNLCMNNE